MSASTTGPTLVDAHRPFWVAVAWVGILVGTALRLIWWSVDRSLVVDESMTAINIFARSFVALVTRPLDLEQTAPPGFLILAWLASRLPMEIELAMRLPSLIAGIAVLPATLMVARRLSGGGVALAVAVSIVAFAPEMILWSAQLKSYVFDALAAVSLVWLGTRPVTDGTGLGRLAASGSVALFFSTPAMFILAGVGLAGFGMAWQRRERREIVSWLAVGILWSAVFLAVYLIWFRSVAESPFMLRYWDRTFLSFDAGTSAPLIRSWLATSLSGRSHGFGIRGYGAMFGLTVAIAGYLVARYRPIAVSILLAGPIVVAALASVAQRYPFVDRLLLFTIPLIALFVADGVFLLAARRPRALAVIAATAMAGIMIGPSLGNSIRHARSVAGSENLGHLLTDEQFRSATNEPAYVFGGALPAWLIYAGAGYRDRERLRTFVEVSKRLGPPAGNAPSRGRPVEREGTDLVFTDAGRTILLGVPSGYEIVYRSIWSGEHRLDEGWSANEADRLIAASPECGWTIFSHHRPFELEALDSALLARGRIRDRILQGSGAEIRRYCPATPARSV
jgi:hypothetical protein